MKGIRITGIAVLAFSMLLAATRVAPETKVSNAYQPKVEPTNQIVNTSQYTSPITYPNVDRNSVNMTLADSSKNGYGLIVSMTNPIGVTSEGWILGYRQWAGDTGTSGQIGAAYSPDGANWTTYTNLNPGLGLGRYPSAVATDPYPYVFWNEYTGEGTGYGGRAYYTYDEFGWDGGSFATPLDVDILWNDSKDLWVGSPSYAYDEANDMHYFNVSYSDWTRDNVYMFHSEAYDDGFIIFGSEIVVIDVINDLVGGDDDGKYNSDAITEVNNDGIGYVATSAYFLGADQTPPTSQYTNIHSPIFKMTENYGATWTGGQGGSNYYYIPEDVFESMMGDNYPDEHEFPSVYVSECDGTTIEFEKLFCTYDFDLKVDSDGNPHFIIGVLPSAGDGVYPGMPYNGLYHFWIDKDYLMNPGVVNTDTGWNYSRLFDTGNIWNWENADGESYWQKSFPSFAISDESDDIMWVVVAGPDQGDFVVTDDGGTPDDECDDLGYYPTWNEEIWIVKSVDGGQSWWCPYNMTNTPADCWINENNDFECADDEICPDGETQDEPDEVDAHAGTGATNSVIPVMYQAPDWCYGSTTGDMSAQNHKCRVFAGWVELTTEDLSECIDCVPGDVNLDTAIDILDIIAILNNLLYGFELPGGECAGDFNADGSIDILDIVAIVNYILYNRAESATFANIQINDNAVEMAADGFVGAVQMTLIHDGSLTLDITDAAMTSGYSTEGTRTTVIIVAPEAGELFTADNDFQIESIVAASGDSYITANIAQDYALLSSYPNPFNPETTISYDIMTDGMVEVAIYNLMGQKVASLVNNYHSAGSYTVNWAGQDHLGNAVSSGVYFAQLTSGNEVVTNKITLLR